MSAGVASVEPSSTINSSKLVNVLCKHAIDRLAKIVGAVVHRQ
jgi:hypothetical protein